MRKKIIQDTPLSADNLTVVLMLNGEPMLYLGPVETRQRLQQIASSRPRSTTAIDAYAKDTKGTTIFLPLEEEREEALDFPPQGVERRINPDRRAKSEGGLVDTRAGKDRRKARRSINISI